MVLDSLPGAFEQTRLESNESDTGAFEIAEAVTHHDLLFGTDRLYALFATAKGEPLRISNAQLHKST